MLILCAFHSCWRLFCSWPNPTWCILHCRLKTIWDNFQTVASDSYFLKKRNDWVSKKTKTINLSRNHIVYPTLFHAVSMQSACSISYCFFFHSYASSQFSSQGTVNSMRRTHFFELDHATMSGHFSIWIIWTGNCRDFLRSAETFQSLAPFSSFILEFFVFEWYCLWFHCN